MPPCLLKARAPASLTFGNTNIFTSFLLPFLQIRSASILGSLSDNPSAYGHLVRRGRGPSSGKGKTSGRGHKGQKQHGKVPARFQGGQTPIPTKRGFKNLFSVEMSTVNLDRIQSWIDQGRLDPTRPITVKELIESRCLHGVKDGVKVLARGKELLKTPVDILVSRASTEAIQAIEGAGGKITTRYYTKQAIRRILKGEMESSPVPFGLISEASDGDSQNATISSLYRMPDPVSRKDLEYYRDEAHRGYLSHMVPEGQGPSLFFKTPGSSVRREKRVKVDKKKVEAEENKLW